MENALRGIRPSFVLFLALTMNVLGLCGTVPAWTKIGPESGDVTSVVINPLDPNIVYAGTLHGGVFRSSNGGGSWTAVNSGLTTNYMTALAINRLSSQTIYAGTANRSVFKSTNGGGVASYEGAAAIKESPSSGEEQDNNMNVRGKSST